MVIKSNKVALYTLRDLFDSDFEAIQEWRNSLDPKTVQSYLDSIRLFEKVMGSVPMASIDEHEAARFIQGLRLQKGKKGLLKPNSVHKHCGNIDTILKMAGPKTRHNKRGLGILPTEPPIIKAPKIDTTADRGYWTIQEMRAMYSEAGSMTTPNDAGISPRDWWQTFLCLAFYTGMKIDQLITAEYSMLISGPRTYLKIPAKSNRGRERHQYLHPEAAEHVECMRRSDRARICDWPNWKARKRIGYEAFRQLQEHAGIPESRRFTFNALCETHRVELAKVSLAYSDFKPYVKAVPQEVVESAIDKLPSLSGKTHEEYQVEPYLDWL